MPVVLFDDDADLARGRAFCSAALRAGAWFHPRHNLFLSLAHGEADIDRALVAAAAGFEAVVKLPEPVPAGTT
jgi:glutamate-1-semialdehyde 2,1-aminomutase